MVDSEKSGYIVQSGMLDRFMPYNRLNGVCSPKIVAIRAIEEHVKSGGLPVNPMISVYEAETDGRKFWKGRRCLLSTPIEEVVGLSIYRWLLVKVDEKEMHQKLKGLSKQLDELSRRVTSSEKGVVRRFFEWLW